MSEPKNVDGEVVVEEQKTEFDLAKEELLLRSGIDLNNPSREDIPKLVKARMEMLNEGKYDKDTIMKAYFRLKRDLTKKIVEIRREQQTQ